MSISQLLTALVSEMSDTRLKKMPGVKKREIVLKLMVGLSKDLDIDQTISEELLSELIELVIYLAKNSDLLRNIASSKRCCS
jgi:hypothetical protein